MRHSIMRTTIVVILAFAGLVLVTPTALAADKDCGDFDTQAQAQNFYENAGPGDPHALDADDDGVACESLPCPCSTGGGGGGGDAETDGPKVLHQLAKVVRVIDGDTVRLNLIPGPKRTVRLLGIDTPEVYGGEECFGPEASRKAKKLMPKGSRVRLHSDPTQALKDRYGRLLRYVNKAGSGLDVGRRLVWTGRAQVYVFNNDPFKRVGAFRKAQKQANQADRGLWGAC